MKQKILVTGDGILGRITAISMNNLGFDVTHGIDEVSSIKKNERYFSINLLSRDILQNNGIWENISTSEHLPFNKIITWDSLQEEEVCFESKSIGHKNLGFIIPESVLLAVTLRGEDDLKIRRVTFKDIGLDYQQYLKDQPSINTKNKEFDYIIRTNSESSREEVSKKSYKVDYNQQAMVLNIKVTQKTSNVAYQKFLPGQILGLLPIDNMTYNLIWSMDTDKIEKIKTYSMKKIQGILSQELSEKIGTISSISTYNIFPLSGYLYDTEFKGRLINIGSALHNIHPLAGLGLNLGFQDLFVLENSIINTDSEITSVTLNAYKNNIRPINKSTYFSINFLKKFYSDITGSKVLRRMLLQTFNKAGFIKRHAIKAATGCLVKKQFSKKV